MRFFCTQSLLVLLYLSLAGPVAVAQSDPLDPMETFNRPIHELNRGLDSLALRPLAFGYRSAIPRDVRSSVSNFLENLRLPLDVLNYLLQFRFEDASRAAVRFGLNSSLGLGGLFDVATAHGLERKPTDFGLTLARYGIGTGPYLVIPAVGPLTLRDFVGLSADFYANPLTHATGGSATSLGVSALRTVDTRARNYGLVNEILYDSPDSYSAVRISYLQIRARQEAGGETSAEYLPDLFFLEEIDE